MNMSLDDYCANLEADLKLRKGFEYFIPHFESGASTNATALFFLEAPGPQVRKTEKISLGNNDLSASNLKSQLEEAKVPLENILLWNIVPWIRREGVGFDKPTSQDIKDAREYHKKLFEILPQLHTLIFVGRKAQSEMVYYSGHTKYRLLAAFHPSAQSMAVKPRWKDNVDVFKRLNETVEYGGQSCPPYKNQ
jgi:uracil-DNA glycosylase